MLFFTHQTIDLREFTPRAPEEALAWSPKVQTSLPAVRS
jgi:hypothetical protein